MNKLKSGSPQRRSISACPSFIASSSASWSTGSERQRTPTALAMAMVMAGLMGIELISPTPLAP